MNLNDPHIAPLANWCISALLTMRPITFDDVPKDLCNSEDVFHAVMDEIVLWVNTGTTTTVH